MQECILLKGSVKSVAIKNNYAIIFISPVNFSTTALYRYCIIYARALFGFAVAKLGTLRKVFDFIM